MHKDKKITLLPLSPLNIVKHAKEINNKPPIDFDKNNEIKLQGGALLATTSATTELCDNLDAPCLLCFVNLLCLVHCLLSLTFCRSSLMEKIRGRL